MKIQKKPVTLSITSGKGGVGKTSIAVNLAFALAEKDFRVLVVDGDLGLANVDVLLGLSVNKTIRDVLDKGADPMESVIYLDKGIGILPASSGVPDMVTLGPEEQNQLGEYMDLIAGQFDYVLVDTAAGIGPSVLWFNGFTTYSIIVLSPDPASLTDAYALIKILSRDYNKRKGFHVVLNFVTREQEDRKTCEVLTRVAKEFLDLDMDYLGYIPKHDAVAEAMRKRTPFVLRNPQSGISRSIFALAEKIFGFKGE